MPGTGERLFDVIFLKRIFAIAPLQVKSYLNLNDPNDPKDANIELSIDSTAISQQTTDALNLKADKSDVWTKAQSNILSANVSAIAASLYDNYYIQGEIGQHIQEIYSSLQRKMEFPASEHTNSY